MFGYRKSFKSKKVREKRRKILLIKTAVILTVFLVLMGLLAWLSSHQSMLIEEVKTEGNIVVTTQEITEIVNKNITGKYLWLFHKDNFLIYPKNQIKEEIEEKFKRLSKVNIYFDDFKSILVSVDERNPYHTWCQKNEIINLELPEDEVVEKNYSKDCYFVDETGYIFSKAPQFSGTAFFEFYTKTYKDEEEIVSTNVIGQYVLEPQLFGRIVMLKNIIDDFGLKNISLVEKGDNDYEIFLEKGGKIIFNIEDDLEKSLNNLKVALETDAVNEDMKNNGASLEYIDLRFGNKVFYRFDN